MTDGAAARRRDRLADRPFPLAAAARPLAAPLRHRPATMSRIGARARGLRGGLPRAAQARLSRRERHHPAQGGGAGARRPRSATAPRAIGAANTLTFGPTARSTPTTPTATASSRTCGRRRRLDARRPVRRWCSAPAAPRGPSSRRCSPTARPRSGSPTAPAPAPRRCATHFGAARRRRRLGDAAAAAEGAATIVNTTSLGMDGPAGRSPFGLDAAPRGRAGHRHRLRRRSPRRFARARPRRAG